MLHFPLLEKVPLGLNNAFPWIIITPHSAEYSDVSPSKHFEDLMKSLYSKYSFVLKEHPTQSKLMYSVSRAVLSHWRFPSSISFHNQSANPPALSDTHPEFSANQDSSCFSSKGTWHEYAKSFGLSYLNKFIEGCFFFTSPPSKYAKGNFSLKETLKHDEAPGSFFPFSNHQQINYSTLSQ